LILRSGWDRANDGKAHLGRSALICRIPGNSRSLKANNGRSEGKTSRLS
jgi:hypothetical protein